MEMAALGRRGDEHHLPSLPPGYEVAIEQCNLVGSAGSRGNTMSSGQTTAGGNMPLDENERTGENQAKPPSIIIAMETEESRAIGVLRESRWLMEDNLSTEAAESLLRACGSDGSFLISNTASPNEFSLYCRRISSDGSVDCVEHISIGREPTGLFSWQGQGQFESLAAVAARFLHLNPHKHCPMFANRRMWTHFSTMFIGDVNDGFELTGGEEQADTGVALHNTINQNDWFFPALTEDQAAYMLNQHGKSDSFVVSNQLMAENYVMSTRQSITGLDQDIVEHLRITKLMDGVFQMAGDSVFHQHLDAVVKAYREANPSMHPLFERSPRTAGAGDGDSLMPSINLEDDAMVDGVMAPPEYDEASVLPNPDDLHRLPTVPALTIPERDDQTHVLTEITTVSPAPTAPTRTNRPTDESSGSTMCCVIF